MPLSKIETLPVELLQPIFISSGCSIALLKASLRISVKLSSRFVYDAACEKYLKDVLDGGTQQAEGQTVIFASRWMTWSYFKSWLLIAFEQNGCLCGMAPDEGCFDAQWPPNFEYATEMVFSRSHLPRLAFVRGRIPKKLLTGPWTSDKVQFLRFLLWITSMSVFWPDEESRMLAREGRRRAVLEKNLEAVELFNHNRRLGKLATLSSVRFAVFEGDCDRSIVYDTMYTAQRWGSGISWECAELDAWCAQRVKDGDPKGLWLKTKLEELRAPSRPGKVYQGPGIGYKHLPGGELDPIAGDYDGGVDDRLCVNQDKWNQNWLAPNLQHNLLVYTAIAYLFRMLQN
ncbi:hypothetical protein FB567DRAFT_557860 [Paraphoma chrysanthemicola]|uniref:Uncharacterized protein n=1 Tax=Paraphoma chrysanthemicola TaxID=798071 RepID=A0A8K0RGJ8_9PLEO|nr:hypothetical protein FB567DRAFT_557860 [Paraphoma chrysanthemicola]